MSNGERKARRFGRNLDGEDRTGQESAGNFRNLFAGAGG